MFQAFPAGCTDLLENPPQSRMWKQREASRDDPSHHLYVHGCKCHVHGGTCWPCGVHVKEFKIPSDQKISHLTPRSTSVSHVRSSDCLNFSAHLRLAISMFPLFVVLIFFNLVGTIHGIVSSQPIAQFGDSVALGIECRQTNAYAFYGIPYALPPLKGLRFSSSRPAKYTGFLNATEQAPSCLQFGLTNIVPGPQSEDW